MSNPVAGSSCVSLAAALLFLSFVGPALAHAKLVSSTPAPNAMAMPPPTELHLKFSEGIELKFTKVSLTGPDKKAVKTEAAKLDGDDKTTVIVPLTATLPDGKYTVSWQALSTDGHRTKGTYSFQSMH